MSHQYSEQVEVILGRSRRAEAFVLAGATASAALVGGLPLDDGWRVLGLLWTALVALRALRGLRPGLRLRVDRRGAIEANSLAGSLRDGSFVAPWLAVIRWRPAGAWRDRTLLVAPDMLRAEQFRRLRVLLRFGDRPLGPLSRGPERTMGTDLGARHGS